tara:strand:- start:3254 stop:3436 length:183 start_codon:yes stop_codon:yes gene_type:complete
MSTTWNVRLKEGAYAFLVTNCNNEKEAKKNAREWLGVYRLPLGTDIWQYPEIPERSLIQY